MAKKKHIISEKVLRQLLKSRKMTAQILDELAKLGIIIDAREWRRFVRTYNNGYENRERFIVSDVNGYILTTKKDAIKASAIKRIKTGASMIRNAKADLDELGGKRQLSLLKEEADIYDLASKLEI